MYEINLLPVELRGHLKVKKHKPIYILAALLAGILLVIFCVTFIHRFLMMQNQLALLNRQLIKTKPKVKEVTRLKQEQREIDESAGVLESLMQERKTWAYTLKEIKNAIPVDTWLTGIYIYPKAGAPDPAPDMPDISPESYYTGKSGAPVLVEDQMADTGTIIIRGKTADLSSVGLMVNSLNRLNYIEKASINNINENTTEKIMDFSITLYPEESDNDV